MFNWKKRSLRGEYTALYNYLKGSFIDVEVSFFSLETSNRMRGKGIKVALDDI